MNLIIIKNGHIIARTEDDGAAEEYSFVAVDTLPEYPNDGKVYNLDLVNDVLTWVEVPHIKTIQEQLDEINEYIDEQKYAWKLGASYAVGDRCFYNGKWYVCITAHTAAAENWTPDLVPALWNVE